jgi:hypothetical protein
MQNMVVKPSEGVFDRSINQDDVEDPQIEPYR